MNIIEIAKDIRILLDKLATENMTKDELIAHPGVIKGWQADTDYEAGDVTRLLNILYECLEDHRSGAEFDHTKFKIMAASSTDIIPDWVMPTTESGGYYVGDVVTHNGKIWVSESSNNYEEPGKGTLWTVRT